MGGFEYPIDFARKLDSKAQRHLALESTNENEMSIAMIPNTRNDERYELWNSFTSSMEVMNMVAWQDACLYC